MNNKIILRLSNEVGNQMFMYASAYAISKELNRTLCVDNETAFLSKKNVSKFGLDSFEITSEIAPDTLKFKFIYYFIFIIFKIFFTFKMPLQKQIIIKIYICIII